MGCRGGVPSPRVTGIQRESFSRVNPGALAASVHTVTGQITNKSLRALVTTLLAAP